MFMFTLDLTANNISVFQCSYVVESFEITFKLEFTLILYAIDVLTNFNERNSI